MIELDKTIIKKIAFYYLSDATGLFSFLFFFWFIIRRIALDKTMNKRREYCILLFKWCYNEKKKKEKEENIAFYYLKYIKGH